jgi:hypothetical protein
MSGMSAAASAVRPREETDRLTVIERGGELTLPRQVAHDLRLLRAEPFVAFSEGRSFVHLLRADAGPAALLAAERLSLHGSIEGFGIADLFSLLNMSRRNGLLLLIADQNQEPLQKSVYFRRGEIVYASSNQPEERIGQVLYRTGKLDRGALAEAERWQEPGKRFGAVLLEHRLLDAATLSWGLKHQVEEIVFSVFRLSRGSFFFFDGDLLESDLAQTAIDTNNVLMEGYQRVDELGLIGEHIRGRGTVLRATGRKPEGKLSEKLTRLLGLIDGRTAVEEIVRATGWGEFNTFKALYKLLQAKVVETVDAPAAAPPKEDPLRAELAAVVETYNRAFLLLRDVLRAKAVEIDLVRAFDVFLRSAASDAARAVFHGVSLGAGRRFAAEALIDNADHLLLLETTSLAGEKPPAVRRRDLLAGALAEWTAFQALLVRNLMPSAEARELISYVRAIEQTAA